MVSGSNLPQVSGTVSAKGEALMNQSTNRSFTGMMVSPFFFFWPTFPTYNILKNVQKAKEILHVHVEKLHLGSLDVNGITK